MTEREKEETRTNDQGTCMQSKGDPSGIGRVSQWSRMEIQKESKGNHKRVRMKSRGNRDGVGKMLQRIRKGTERE